MDLVFYFAKERISEIQWKATSKRLTTRRNPEQIFAYFKHFHYQNK
jgi:hypothetical protein